MHSESSCACIASARSQLRWTAAASSSMPGIGACLGDVALAGAAATRLGFLDDHAADRRQVGDRDLGIGGIERAQQPTSGSVARELPEDPLVVAAREHE